MPTPYKTSSDEVAAARWVTFEELEGNSDDFEAIGEAFAAAGFERRGRVASGDARLMAVRDLVDFAADWMTTHRVRT